MNFILKINYLQCHFLTIYRYQLHLGQSKILYIILLSFFRSWSSFNLRLHLVKMLILKLKLA